MRYLLALYPAIRLVVSLSIASPNFLNLQPSNELLLPGNFTLRTNVSGPLVTKAPKYDCIGGADYGDSVSLRSCRDAQHSLLENLEISPIRIISFKDRRGIGGAGHADVPLPYMSLSSDGQCAIEIVSDAEGISETATIADLRRWARDMITTCSINNNEVKGGTARNLGKYGNLGLILTKFDHQRIVCAGLARPNLKDCEALLDQMPATDIWEEFGSRDEPNVEVPIPWVISGDHRRCRITVTSDGPPDGEKWYTLWKLSAAVVKLCVSGSGRAGIAYDSGLYYKMIDIEVS